MYCRNCGTKLRDGAMVCPKCGTPTRESRIKALNAKGLFISYAVALLITVCSIVGGMFSTELSSVYNSITGYTLLNLFIVFFALTASIYLFMNYSFENKKSMCVFIVIGAVLLIGFCVAAKNLSISAQYAARAGKSTSDEVKKAIAELLTVTSFIMCGLLISGALAVITGAFGLAGKLKESVVKTNNVAHEEIEELEEVEEA